MHRTENLERMGHRAAVRSIRHRITQLHTTLIPKASREGAINLLTVYLAEADALSQLVALAQDGINEAATRRYTCTSG